MAAEPINIFSHKQDLPGVAALLRQLAPDATVTGPDQAWQRIEIKGKTSWLRKAPTLIFKNAPEYYNGPDWPKQVAGMQGYFNRFPNVPRKPDIMRLIGSFHFALATDFEPDLFLQSNDPRLKILFAVARLLDGVLFTPSGLWDSDGRVLLGADGKSDPSAKLPNIPPLKASVSTRITEESTEDIDEESIPPEATRVAKRALCLAAVSGRGFLEMEKMPPAQAETTRSRLVTWAGELALETEFEPAELNLLKQPAGSLSMQAMVNAGWRLEGLGVLAWALGKFELPPYDQLIDAAALFPIIGFLNLNQACNFLGAPKLRSADELRKLQQQCFALHWRLRDFHLRKRSLDFETFARESWFGPLDVSVVRFCENDLAIGELPILQASDGAVRTALSTANERHLAINWLVEGGDIYSKTHTST